MIRGETQFHGISRFVKEIPQELIQGNTWEPKPRDEFLGERPISNRQKDAKMKNAIGSTDLPGCKRFWNKNPKEFTGLWRSDAKHILLGEELSYKSMTGRTLK